MGAVTYPDSNVISFITSNLIPVQVLFDAQPLATDFNVKWTPTLIILGRDRQEHHRSVGFLDAQQLIASLTLGIGKYHFDNDRFTEALSLFEQLFTSFPKSDVIPEAMYLTGVCRFKKTEDPAYLKEAYENLLQNYPDNEWTRRAYPYSLL